MAWLQPEVVERHRLTALALGPIMLLQGNFPYVLPIFSYPVFVEQWWGLLVHTAFVFTCPSSISGEIAIATNCFEKYRCIGQWFVTSQHAPQLGLLVAVIFTVVDVVRDTRDERWQGRWRFRHDAPILPRVLRPRPPGEAGVLR